MSARKLSPRVICVQYFVCVCVFFWGGRERGLQERLGCPVTDRKIDYAEIAKIWLVKFCMFNFKIVYLAEFSADLKIFISKSKLGSKIKKNFEN